MLLVFKTADISDIDNILSDLKGGEMRILFAFVYDTSTYPIYHFPLQGKHINRQQSQESEN